MRTQGGGRAADKRRVGRNVSILDYNHRIALGSGARERQFNDQDNELESPGYRSSVGRLTSQNRTVQVEPLPDNPSNIPDADGQPETSASVLHKSPLT
jgi:hypothetical protein